MKRRTFLKLFGSAALFTPLGKLVPHSFGAVAPESQDHVLIIVELLGGNDGLNTVIPFTDPAYYTLRDRIAVSEDSLVKLSDSLGLHPEMEELLPLWEAGSMAVVNGAGYPAQDLSHFRSRDIWHGATTAPTILTGWMGRYLEYRYPAYPSVIPDDPPGLEIKNANTLLMQGTMNLMGLAVTNPDTFYTITQALSDIPLTDAQNTAAGNELHFLQELSSQAGYYAEKIYTAFNQAENRVEYPTTPLAQDFALIARLIGGGLSTPVYAVGLDGFDTHANQLRDHPTLLRTLSEAIATFLKDIEELDVAEHVVIVTTSEFGRRVEYNGSGTDHGTAAPLFLFGSSVNGDLYGEQPSLTDLDEAGNMKHTIDFRQVYAAILEQWMGVSSPDSAAILEGEFETLPLFL